MEESNFVLHAKRELALMGMPVDGPADDMNTRMAQHIITMVRAFGEEGHSGFSASYAIGLLEKVLRFEPLSPITGADSEWNEVGDGIFQNNRCSHVFKENGEAYDIDGIIWRDPDGSCCTNFESRAPVTFPYVPKREYRNRKPTVEELEKILNSEGDAPITINPDGSISPRV